MMECPAWLSLVVTALGSHISFQMPTTEPALAAPENQSVRRSAQSVERASALDVQTDTRFALTDFTRRT